MAINFPATTSQATDGSFTHTSSGITWAWDGTTWNAQGVTGSYSLPTASTTVIGGVKIGSNLTIAGDGTLDAQTGASVDCFKTIAISGQNPVVADTSSDTLTFAAGTGITLATNSSSDTITINATGGGGSGLQSRTSANAPTSASHATNTAENIQITAAKTYALQKIQTSAAAWVTLYVSDAARVADSSRTEEQDPNPGSGVIAEVITSDGATQNITPATIGWNDEATPTTDAYLKVVNKSGSTQPITVTLYFVALEA